MVDAGLKISAMFLLGLAACASEGSVVVEGELQALDARASEGVVKISRALGDPSLASPELGEGSRLVAKTARALAQLEVDQRANDVQQLMAIVYQARIWDDVVTAYATVTPPSSLTQEQGVLFLNLVAEKSLPARISAATSYERARERACEAGLDGLPVMTEILAGIDRHVERAVSLDPPCAAE